MINSIDTWLKNLMILWDRTKYVEREVAARIISTRAIRALLVKVPLHLIDVRNLFSCPKRYPDSIQHLLTP